MIKKSKEHRIRYTRFSVRQYFTFFLLMSFVITCCMLLFLHNLTAATGLVLTEEMIERAAKLTFANVMLLSFLCTMVDGILRKYTVERPVNRILDAAGKIMQGDFSVRIQPLHGIDRMDGFDIIIDYFNQMAEELSGTETLRNDFIANVSHELKTPLAVI